ncbi:type VI secretion system tube protein TssD [Desulfatiglans anilini]|uniref:type VI secretion system tube protein TssD n=1 Tax=Desulfatiglans anilini TaxID=90728 RepID=UPI000409DD24|nr:type VI secretion system tube protein TssD [Desulfatiglans anilini]
MAQTVHLFLKANGQDIQGDSTITSMERENSIECLSFKDSVRTAREAATGMATGQRTYEPLRIVKRIDKSSPLLFKALTNNEVIEGVFKFYRPNPAGDGTTQHFFTIEIQEGRISTITRFSPDVIDPASANTPPTEEVSFVFGYIRMCYEPDGVEHIDHWSERT